MKSIRRILLVEDDIADAELTRAALGSPPEEELVVLNDGVQALDYLSSRNEFAGRPPGQPALILLDLKMPRLSGEAVLQQLKEQAETRCVPVVILSSSREPRDLEACYQMGVNAYIVKPVQFRQFVETMQVVKRFWIELNELPTA